MTAGARRRVAAVAVVSLLGSGALAGCGSASETSPPAGVDGLVVPTPAPEQSDFVGLIDNPWLPLAPGTVSTYALSGTSTGTGTVSVAEESVEVAGVACTPVQTVDPSGTTTDYFAQDRAGNVWWLGRAGVWEAGVDGARAGLAMAASPRVGDGYRAAYLAGVVEDAVTVLSVAADVRVGARSYVGVETRTTSELAPTRTDHYVRGRGLVRSEQAGRTAVLSGRTSGGT